jgi:small subunit ribosomal protein S16
MATKIRLQRHGRSKRPYYYIVVADSRARRDGRFIDRIGDYNPLTVPATINIDFDKAFDWVMKGAEPSDTCARILSYKGVLYKKHLARGVRKGAMTEVEMEAKMQEWIAAKEKTVEAHIETIAQSRAAKKAASLAEETKKKEDYAKKLEDAAKPAEEVAEAPEVNAEAADAPEADVVAETPAEDAPAAEETAETPAE